MIQRKQTLWLLLATAAGVLTFLYPFATGTELVENSTMERQTEIIAGGNFFLLLATIASIAISTINIFLFKNRGQQKMLCIIGLLISAVICVLYISLTLKLTKYVPALWAILPFIIVVSYFMAYRGIRSDEKLVKSLDKLR
jgi:peptidoglycan/LPS O-acetylase OafA/YrhL